MSRCPSTTSAHWTWLNRKRSAVDGLEEAKAADGPHTGGIHDKQKDSTRLNVAIFSHCLSSTSFSVEP